MNIKFKITFEDDSYIESHDAMYNETKTHAHALPPNNTKKWKRYELITDDGQFVGVDFRTGVFIVNGSAIHVADKDGYSLTHRDDIQDFDSAEERKLLNGMPYYPIFGKRIVNGEFGHAEISFCGWKRKHNDRTIEKVIYIYPNGSIVLQ